MQIVPIRPRVVADSALSAAGFVALTLAGLSAASLSAQAPNPFASRIIAADTRGGAGGGIFAPTNALGRPDGSTNVHSLGVGGSLTLGFDVTIVDGLGVDLVVAENPFRSFTDPDRTFAEVCFVEVSSDGVVFARVPTRYDGPQADPGVFAFVEVGAYEGFAGTLPIDPAAADPLDPVSAGGDAIDLATLQGHPAVVSGAVDLGAITQVRLVDARSGIDTDSRGITVWDTGDGSADIDGVTVLQHAGNQVPRGPTVDVSIPANGRFSVTWSDPDGLTDLDPASVGVSLWGIQLSFGDLLGVTVPVRVTSTALTLELPSALPAALRLQMSATARDRAGARASDADVRG